MSMPDEDAESGWTAFSSQALHRIDEVRQDGMVHAPVDAHGLIVARGDVIYQPETIERAGVAKAVFLVFANKEHELLLVLRLLHKPSSPALVGVGIL